MASQQPLQFEGPHFWVAGPEQAARTRANDASAASETGDVKRIGEQTLEDGAECTAIRTVRARFARDCWEF